MDDTNLELKCAKINLKHSRVATANLMKYVADTKVDIICIQEPYTHKGRAAGIEMKYRTFTAGKTRSRTAVTITDRSEDATLISTFRRRYGHTGDNKRRHQNHACMHVLRLTKTH
jgi:exonuclease III